MSYFIGKIKQGTRVFVDFHTETVGKDIDAETVFLMKKLGNDKAEASAPGFGARSNYGNGSFTIYSMSDVEMLSPVGLWESPMFDEYRNYKGY